MKKRLLIAILLTVMLLLTSAQLAFSQATCDLTVQAPDGVYVELFRGSTRVAHGTVSSGSIVFTLAQDTYDVRLRQGSVYTTFAGLGCTGEAQTLDTNATLTVNAPTGTYVEVFAGSNRAVDATISAGDSITLSVVKRADYTARLKQGSAYISFPADASSGADTVEALATLTVTAPSGTYVEVFKGTDRVVDGTTSSALDLKVVRYSEYRVRFKQGSVYTNFEPVNCEGQTCSKDVLTQVTVNAPNGSYVEIFVGNNRAIDGTVPASDSITMDVVSRSDYSVRIKQGSGYFSFPADATTSTTVDASAILSTTAPGGTYVEVFKGNDRVNAGTTASALDLELVRYDLYRVRLKQGSVYTNFQPIDCLDGTCELDGLSQLTVTAPAGSYVEVFADNNRATYGTVPASKTLTLDVVPRSDYTVRIKHGSAYFSFTGNNCTGDCSLDALCSISLKAPQGVYVEIYKGSERATAGTVPVGNTISLDVVRYQDFKVRLKMGSQYYYFQNVDASVTCPADLSKSQLKVEFPGMKLNRVTIKNQAGGTVTYKDWPTDSWTFSLDYGLYDIVLQHGAKTKTVEDVYVLGQVNVNNIVSDATINFEGIKLNRLTIQTTTGGTVTYKDWPQDLVQIPLLKNTYNVLFQQGAATYSLPLDATASTASIPSSDVVCTLDVQFPEIKLNRVTVQTPGGGTVIYKDWPTDNWSVKVLKGTYTVVLQQGAEVKTVSDVICTGASQTVNGIVSDATIHFDGIKLNRATIQTTSGGTVIYKDWPQNTAQFFLLKDSYKALLQQGAATIERDLAATGDTADIPRDQVVCDLKVEFPGIKLNRVTVKTPSGGTVIYKDWPVNEWTVALLQGTYTVELQHGAKVKTVENVNCTGTSGTVSNIVSTLTVNFPGMKANRVTVKTTSGGTVIYRDWPQDQAVFALLKNHYQVQIQVGSISGVADVDCTGNTCTLAGSNLVINAPAGVTVKVKHYTNGAILASGTVASNQWLTISNLPIGIYDIELTQGTHTIVLQDQFHIAGTTLDMLNELKVNAPAGVLVQVKKSSGLVTSGTVASNQWVTLYVLKDSYDLFLKQNAEEKTTGVNCTNETTSVDELAVLKINAPVGTKVKVYIPNTTDAVTSGVVASNQWVTLYVVPDTYDIYLEQNTGTKTLHDQVIGGDTTTIDELCILTVNAPAGAIVKVLEGGVVTSGTVASNQWVTLYVVKDSYDIELTQGGEVKTLNAFDCSGDTATTDQLAELRVNAPAGTGVEVLTGGIAVTSGTVASNQWVTLYVVKDNYDLKLTQGAEVKNVTGADFSSSDVIVEDHLSVLRVNAPAGTTVKIRVPTTTSEVTSGTVASNQWVTLYVVSDMYDVYMEQGAGQKTLLNQDVTTDSDLNELCTLKVKTTAGTQIKVFVSTTNDLVTNGTVASNQWVTLYVVRNTYDVFDGSTTKPTDCTGATVTVLFP